MRMRRILAFVMALILTCSAFGSASITGYAAPIDGVETETVTVTDEDTEETVASVDDEAEDTEEPSGEVTDEEGESKESPEGSTEVAEITTTSEKETSTEVVTTEVVATEETSEEVTTEEVTTEETVEETMEELVTPGMSAMATSLENLAYTGEVSDNTLYIHEWGMNEANVDFTAENIQTILAAWNGNFIGDVTFDYPSGSITAGVWNAAKALAGSEGDVHININPEGEPQQIWMFSGLSTATGNTNVGVTCFAGEAGEGWTFTLDNVSFKAKSADLNLGVDAYTEDAIEIFNTYKTAIYGEGNNGLKSLVLVDKNGNVLEDQYVGPSEGDDYYNITISDINLLTKSVPYTIKMMPYVGDEWSYNGKTYIEFSTQHMEDKDEFTEDELLTLVETMGDKKYDGIQITSKRNSEDTNTWIYSSVVAEAAKHVKDDGYLEFYYYNADTYGTELVIWEPSTEQIFDSQLCKANVRVEDGKGYLTFDLPEINANKISIQNRYSSEYDIYAPFIEAYGSAERALKLAVSDLYVSGVQAASWVERGRLWLYVGNVQKLVNNSVYEIRDAVYHGTVSENSLTVDCNELEKIEDDWTEDRIAEIINEYDCKFDTINVVVDDYNRCSENGKLPQYTIDAAIYNAAVNHLSGNPEGLYYTIEQEYYTDETLTELVNDGEITWHFTNPAKVSGDIAIGYDLYVSEYGFPMVAFNTPSKLGKTIINVEDTYNTKYDWISELKSALGGMDSYYLYPYDVVGTAFSYLPAEDGSMTVTMCSVNELVDNKKYTVNERLVGEVADNCLTISAEMIGKDIFAAGDLEDYLEKWLSEGSFDKVRIVQKDSANNMIRKAEFNAVRELLNGNSNSEIIFSFDASKEVDLGDGYTEYWPEFINWTFKNPTAATVDIKAKISIKESSKYLNGIEITRGAATFPSSGVDVTITSQDPKIGGIWTEFDMWNTSSEAPAEGMIFSNAANLTETANTFSCWYDQGTDIITADITDVQKLPTTTCYAFEIREEERPPYSVGVSIPLSVSGNSIYKSFDTSVAYITASKTEASLLPIAEGPFQYARAYTQYGKMMVDVFAAEAIVRLSDMKFVNVPENEDGIQELEITMPPVSDAGAEPATGYLDLRIYPDSAGKYREDLDWNIADTSIVNWIGAEGGELQALKAGTTMVTVTYDPDDGSGPMSISCDVTVKNAVYDEIDSESEWNALFDNYPLIAVTNFDKTLEDVELPVDENGKPLFVWKNKATALTSYASMPYCEFSAVYISPIDGRETDVMIPVEFVTLDSVNVIGSVAGEEAFTGGILADGETLKLGVDISMDAFGGSLQDVQDKLDAWKVDAKLSLVVKEGKTELVRNAEGLYEYTASAEATGKKTITISLMASIGGAKAKEIKKATFIVTVPKKELADFDKLVILKWVDRELDNVGEAGEWYFGIPADSENKFKITAKNLDTTVSKWGRTVTSIWDKEEAVGKGNVIYGELEEGVNYTFVKVPYTIVGEGNVKFSLTVNDEMKTALMSTNMAEEIQTKFVYKDYLPRVQSSALTINTKKEVQAGSVAWEMEDGTSVSGLSYTIKGKADEQFELSAAVNAENPKLTDITVQIKDDVTVKAGKYKLTVNAGIYVDGKGVRTFTTDITVTVTDKLPTVTVKQTQNVNIFYNDAEGYGAVTITATEPIADVQMRGQKNADLDYELALVNKEGSYAEYQLTWKTDTEGKNTKAEFVVSFEGYKNDSTAAKSLNIKKVDKAPVVVLSKKSDTLYNNYVLGADFNSKLTLSANGEPLDMVNVTSRNKESGDVILAENTRIPVAFKKNIYDVEVTANAEGRRDTIIIWAEKSEVQKGTDKFTFLVQEANWTKPVSISYSVKIDTTIPKLELGTKTVTLNRNDALFSNQIATSTLTLKGAGVNLFADELFSSGYGFTYVGKDAKSVKYMTNDLIIFYNDEGIGVRLNDNSIPKGIYKYDIKLNKDGFPSIAATLTVKIVEDAPEKCITVSAKGNIDVLNRDGTNVAYTAKLKNTTGTVVDGYLTGMDADLFDADFEDGKLVVKAKESAILNTKETYKVTPVFAVDNIEGGRTYLTAKEQKIKVKQGKPKITLTSVAGNVLYRDRTNAVTVDIKALLNKTDEIEISDVRLTNYTGTFDVDYKDVDGNVIGFTISQKDDYDTIITNGKSVNLKFDVIFKDKAGNEKATAVTYKLVVK